MSIEAVAAVIEHDLVGGDSEDDARRAIAAFAGDRVLFVDALEHDKDDRLSRCMNLRCVDPYGFGLCYGVIQVWPEVGK